MSRSLVLAGCASVLAMFGFAGARAQDLAPAHFTAAQASHGADLYRDNCTLCHGPHMDDGEFAPSLKGARFKGKWGGKALDSLFVYISSTMPPGQAGSLSSEDYADLVAHILASNGAAPGDKPLPADMTALSSMAVAK